MLGKLFKHEFRTIGKIALLLLAVTVGVTILGIVYIVSPMFKSIVSSSGYAGTSFRVLSVILGLLGLLSYAIALFGISVGYTLFVALRFYRSMFSAEGYLTHTLPVKSWQLMFVKVVTAGVCMMVMNLAIYGTCGFLVLFGYARATDQGMFELFAKISEFWKYASKLLNGALGLNFDGFIGAMIIGILIMPFANASIIFGALSLGQYSWKNKGIMGILAYLGIRMLMSIANGFVNATATVRINSAMAEMGIQEAITLTNGRQFASIAIMLLFAVVLYFMANHVIKNRLNLE